MYQRDNLTSLRNLALSAFGWTSGGKFGTGRGSLSVDGRAEVDHGDLRVPIDGADGGEEADGRQVAEPDPHKLGALVHPLMKARKWEGKERGTFSK